VRACVKCGGPLPLQSGRGRRRIRCESCAPSRNPTAVRPTLAQLPIGGESLLDATTSELRAAGMETSALGQAALLLARRIEDGQDGGAAVASMVKQWQDTMGRATAGVEPAAVPLADQLKARRDARRNA
jgi:hypothetical protein